MARQERPIDPGAGPLQCFAWELRKVRVEAGSPTYRALARKAGYSASTLSEAAAGSRQPSLDVVLAYVGACGGDTASWRERWRELDAELHDPGRQVSPWGTRYDAGSDRPVRLSQGGSVAPLESVSSATQGTADPVPGGRLRRRSGTRAAVWARRELADQRARFSADAAATRIRPANAAGSFTTRSGRSSPRC